MIENLQPRQRMILCAGIATAALRLAASKRRNIARSIVYSANGIIGVSAERPTADKVAIYLGLHDLKPPTDETYIAGSDKRIALTADDEAKLSLIPSDSDTRGSYQAVKSCPRALMQVMADEMAALILNAPQAGARMHRDCAAEMLRAYDEAKTELG